MAALETVCAAGVPTPDVGGAATTREVARAVSRKFVFPMPDSIMNLNPFEQIKVQTALGLPRLGVIALKGVSHKRGRDSAFTARPSSAQ